MASITIPLFYDLDLLRFTTVAGGIARQPNLVLGQSDSIAFAVQFVRSGVVIELTSPAWICGIKPINDVAGDYLCQTTTGIKTGTGTSTVYTFTLLLDSTELRAWLLTVTAVSNYAAFSIRDTVNLIATLPAITCTILPDYTLEGTTPTDASGTLVVDSGATFTVHKTFAMPTDDGQNNYVLKTNGAGVGSWAADTAGTGTVTNVAVTTANGVSGTVANPTASAAITLTLGAITPTTGAFSDTTDATSTTSAPLKTAGGLAVAKSLYVGGIAEFSDNVEINGELGVYDIRVMGGSPLGFFDQGSNPTFKILPIASSVNNVAIEPSITGSPVHIYAQGSDTNIGLHLSPKGTGYVNVEDGTDTTKRLRFGASGNTTGITTTIESASTLARTITLPDATTTLAGLTNTAAFTNKTYNGHTLTAGSSTFTGTAAQTYTFPSTTTTLAGLAIAQTFTASQTLNTTSADNTGLITIKFNGTTKGLIGYRTTDLAGLQITGPAGSGGFQIIDSQTRWFTNGGGAATATLADGVGLSITGTNAGKNLSVAGTTTCTGGVIFGTYTVATFPLTTYLEAVVTDASAPVVGLAVASGGSAKCKVMYNGSAKIVTAVL